MALKKSVGFSLRWLCSVLRCHRQTCPSDLFKPSNETIPCPGQMCPSDLFEPSNETIPFPGQMCQSDMFGDSSEMDSYDEMYLYDNLVVSSHTDACYPDKLSDDGGSSGRWVGKQSEHSRALKQLVEVIQILDLHIELLEQELSPKSNSRLSRLQEIKEKVDVVQKYFH